MSFCWCSGYHICLTRRRSQVRHLHRTYSFFCLIFRETSKEYISTKTRTTKETIRHVGLQTDYRDESTQTIPFSPGYLISDVGQPEVFALSEFTYG